MGHDISLIHKLNDESGVADRTEADDQIGDDFMKSFRKSYAKRKVKEVGRFRSKFCSLYLVLSV
jgi:hypothetical protein